MRIVKNELDYLKDYIPHLIFFTVIIIAVYINSLNNQFVSDDIFGIVNNKEIGNFSTVLANYLRPVGVFIHYIISNLFGLNPAAFRLVNYIVHILTTCAVFFLIRKFFNDKVAFFSTTLFAIHPVISETVVWISAQGYSINALFFLSSFLFYIYSGKSKLFYSLSLLLFFLTVQIQLPALVLVFLFPLYELCFGNVKINWKKIFPFLVFTAIYGVFSFSMLNTRIVSLTQENYQQPGIDNSLLQIPTAISSYLELTFWPDGLTLYHTDYNLTPLVLAFRWAVLLLLILGLIFSFKKNKSIFFMLCLFFVALSPTLTPFRISWVVAERYYYLASVGIFSIIGYAIYKLYEKEKLRDYIVALFIFVIVSLSIRTIIRNRDWRDADSLWIAAARTSPSSPNNHNNLGDYYARNKDYKRAIEEFKTAIKLNPIYADAYHNMGNTYMAIGEYENAEKSFTAAIKFNKNLWQSYLNLALISNKNQKYAEAYSYAQSAYKITNDPNVKIFMDDLKVQVGKSK